MASALMIAGGCVAAAGTGLAAFLAKYPRHPALQAGRYPVGCCLARWEGGPACQIFYPMRKAASDGPRAPFMRREVVQQVVQRINTYVPVALLSFLSSRGPYVQDAPVETEAGRFPVLLFSHGLFGTLDVYKTFCGGLASWGFIVVATEHEDGSAIYARDAQGVNIPYKGPPKGNKYVRDVVVNFRRPYLEKRTEELVTVQGALREGKPSVHNTTLVASVLQQANPEDFFLAGHSFGAASSLAALPKLSNIKACMLLDLWPFPLSPELEASGVHSCPTMYVNSEPFAMGSEIGITQRVILKSPGCLGHFWIDGCAHQSFSDTPCVLPHRLGQNLLMSGKSDPDLVHQTSINCARVFFELCSGSAASPPERAEVEASLTQAEPLLRTFRDAKSS